MLNYRACPNYRSSGGWYDWCMVEWGSTTDVSDVETLVDINNVYSVPAKILCFYSYQDGVEHALVHSCLYQNTHDLNTKITEQWKLQYQKIQNNYIPVITSVNVDVISGRVMVIEPNTKVGLADSKEVSRNKVLLICDRETEWIHSLLSKT